jgi:DNA-binding GntR family transcriptional regulator
MYVVKRAESLRVQAIVQIRQAIVTGQLAPGSMHSEQTIAGSLSISRTPVREALLHLETEGLVAFVPQRGVRIAELDPKHLEWVYQFRTAIESHCAATLAREPRKDVLGALDIALAKQADIIDADAHLKWVEANMEFHTILVRSAENGLMDKSWASLASHSMRIGYRMIARTERMRESLAEERALYEAIRRRDQDRARALAAEHLYVSTLLMHQMFSDLAGKGAPAARPRRR